MKEILLIIVLMISESAIISAQDRVKNSPDITLNIIELEKEKVVNEAKQYLDKKPISITMYPAVRSQGGLNDFFSEGDYWWPDSLNPDGPYIKKDGLTNPDIFIDHRKAMIHFAKAVSVLTSAFKITRDETYARAAVNHLNSWFFDPETKMNPHLLYAQAIKGRVTGRGIGIIDATHLIDVARSIEILQTSKSLIPKTRDAVIIWFKEFLKWMTTHPYGIEEREAKNNHGTWWAAQVAAYAHVVNDTQMLAFIRERYKTVLLPDQMDLNGSFPLELSRTKPYGYSIFNLEGFIFLCHILSTPQDNLWQFTLSDGRNIRKGMEFLFPYLQNKSAWKYPKDVMHFEISLAQRPMLLFAGIALQENKYIDFWKSLSPNPQDGETVRNIPIKQPVLWIEYP